MTNKFFLGWEKPFAQSLVELILSTNEESTAVVLPSISASREVQTEYLKATDNSIKLYSLNQFISSLVKKKVANSSIKNLCWKIALEKTDSKKLARLFSAEYAYGKPNVSSLTNTLSALSEKLYSADLSFAKVASEVKKNKIDNEEFWLGLIEIHENYLELLHQSDYCDPFFELAELTLPLVTEKNIIIAGCHNLTLQTSRLIQALSKKTKLVLAINAPEEFTEGFSETGSLLTEYWENIRAKIPDQAFCFCNSTELEVETAIAHCKQSVSTNIIPLDLSTLTLLDAQLASNELEYESKFPQKALQNSLIHLISSVLNYCLDNSSKNLARLLREPGIRKIFAANNADCTLIGDFNKLISNYYPQKLELNCPILAKKLPGHQIQLGQLAEIINQFRTADSIESAITSLINGLGLEPNQQDANCLSNLLEHAAKIDTSNLSSKNKIPEELLALLQTLSFNTASQASAIKLLPASEAMLCQAEQIIVLGASDQHLPSKESLTPLLHKQLIKVLKIPDYSIANAGYFISFIAHSKAKLKVLCSRQTAQGEPITPSRFLFRSNFVDNAKRVLEFTQPANTALPGLDSQTKIPHTAKLKFELPQPIPHKITTISASSFKDYITCPYFFYLKHVLKLVASSAREPEMSALIFGNLAHRIIEKFSGKIKEGAVDAVFESACEQTFTEYFPWEVFPAVKLQLEQLKYRIQGIVSLQAGLSKEGWKISEIELPFEEVLRDLGLKITGKIDRVDINKSQNTVRVIDFKTSDKISDFKHILSDDGWTDLQLPLYANWIKKRYPEMSLEVAYVNLPKQLQSHSIRSKTLDQAELDIAMNQAKILAADIIANKFSDARPENWPYEFRSLFT